MHSAKTLVTDLLRFDIYPETTFSSIMEVISASNMPHPLPRESFLEFSCQFQGVYSAINVLRLHITGPAEGLLVFQEVTSKNTPPYVDIKRTPIALTVDGPVINMVATFDVIRRELSLINDHHFRFVKTVVTVTGQLLVESAGVFRRGLLEVSLHSEDLRIPS